MHALCTSSNFLPSLAFLAARAVLRPPTELVTSLHGSYVKFLPSLVWYHALERDPRHLDKEAALNHGFVDITPARKEYN